MRSTAAAWLCSGLGSGHLPPTTALQYRPVTVQQQSAVPVLPRHWNHFCPALCRQSRDLAPTIPSHCSTAHVPSRQGDSRSLTVLSSPPVSQNKLNVDLNLTGVEVGPKGIVFSYLS